jgi:hypothetical protein
MSINRIGPFTVVSLSRPPAFVQQELMTRSRPGVDGVSLQRLGTRGKPFQVTSVVDAPTLYGAMSIAQQYASIIGVAAVEVVWASDPFSARGHWFYPMAVDTTRLNRLVLGHGGLNGTSYARLEAIWTLQPVATS